MVRDTSLEAYRVHPKINPSRLRILQAINYLETFKLYPITDRNIAKFLDLDINRVTPRRGELLKAGLIEEVGKIKNENGISVMNYRTKKI